MLKEESDPPGSQQRVQRAAIQEAYQDVLDQETGGSRDHEREGDGHDKSGVRVGIANEVSGRLLQCVGGVGADHYEFAVGQIDDVHQSEG